MAHESTVAQGLARLPQAERARLKKQLTTASIAVWRARQGLDEPQASQIAVSAWRASVRRAIEALATAEGLLGR